MAMGRRRAVVQGEFWIRADALRKAPGHPFYERLNRVLDEAGFDRFCEALCEKFYAAKIGRPSVAPGVYFRMLMVGYFEKLDSERQIAWRCDDSRSLRAFLGIAANKPTPDHSNLSRTRQRIDLATHQAVFDWVLTRLAEQGLLKGKTLGVDASTMEANAAMRSIVRRDTGEGYREFLTALAEESGIETPTAEDLAKFDRQRKGRTCSNDDWHNPHDPDAKIAKMKDGTTHLAYKPEHALDLETGAIVATQVHPADEGDPTTLMGTLEQACESLRAVREEARPAEGDQVQEAENVQQGGQAQEDENVQQRSQMQEGETVRKGGQGQNGGARSGPSRSGRDAARLRVAEVVADKGYHSGQTLVNLEEVDLRGYISEPDRGRRRWSVRASGGMRPAEYAREQAFKRAEQAAVYRNRRRRRGARWKRLHRKRAELLERSFAHVLDGGGMRRVHLRGRENIAKRYLIQTAAFNLGLILRKLIGFGTPKGWADARRGVLLAAGRLWEALWRLWRVLRRHLPTPLPRYENDAVLPHAA